jgi:hypothetical protein
MIRARIVKLASAREGAVAVPLPDSGCAWSSIGITYHGARKIGLRIGDLIDCEVDGGGCAHLIRRVADADEDAVETMDFLKPRSPRRVATP